MEVELDAKLVNEPENEYIQIYSKLLGLEPEEKPNIEWNKVRKEDMPGNFSSTQNIYLEGLQNSDGEKIFQAMEEADDWGSFFSQNIEYKFQMETFNGQIVAGGASKVIPLEGGYAWSPAGNYKIPSVEMIEQMAPDLTGEAAIYVYYETKLHEMGHFCDGLEIRTDESIINRDLLSEARQYMFTYRANMGILNNTEIEINENGRKLLAEDTEKIGEFLRWLGLTV